MDDNNNKNLNKKKTQITRKEFKSGLTIKWRFIKSTKIAIIIIILL